MPLKISHTASKLVVPRPVSSRCTSGPTANSSTAASPRERYSASAAVSSRAASRCSDSRGVRWSFQNFTGGTYVSVTSAIRLSSSSSNSLTTKEPSRAVPGQSIRRMSSPSR